MLGSAVYRMNFLSDGLISTITARHLNQGRGIEKTISQGFNLGREGGREQEILALLWQSRQYFLNIAQKPHVEHAICLIQNKNLNTFK